MAGTPIQAVVHGNNADLIRAVADLYATPSSRIADITYGKGVFWRKTPELNVTGSDVITVPERPYDFTNLPYEDSSFDIVVFDPPYIHNPGTHIADSRYQNAATTGGMHHGDIRDLYIKGIKEAKRITTPKTGQIWVKCKDEIESGTQRWSHVELCLDGVGLGLYPKDLFILLPKSVVTQSRWTSQKHARKPHSYLWVFDVNPNFRYRQTKEALCL